MSTKYFQVFCFFLISVLIIGCKDDVLPKPKSYLSLNYSKATYAVFENNCGYTFRYNSLANIASKSICNFDINYKNMKATVYINYKPVNNNINVLLRDAQKLTYEHVKKADGILEQPYYNKSEKKYGMFYEVTGNAASQSQFYLTDSVKHFLVGSVYFYAKPNYDSVLPASEYVKNDLRVLMESLKWK